MSVKDTLTPIRGYAAVILGDRYDLSAGGSYGPGTQLEDGSAGRTDPSYRGIL
jgi:hypothetical protein